MRFYQSAKFWIILIIIIVIVVVSYIVVASYLTPSTRDAYAFAYTVKVSPQVSGRVENIYIKNNEVVKKGQKLFQIDPRSYVLAVNKAKSQYVEAINKVENVLQSQINIAMSELRNKTINLNLIRKHFAEQQKLAKRGYVSKSQFQTYTEGLLVAQQKVDQAKQYLSALQAQLKTSIEGENVTVYRARVALEEAKLRLSETTVYSPVDGSVANFHSSVGDYANAGSVIMAVIYHSGWAIFANIKESELSRIRKGNKVLVSFALYPGHTFGGKVIASGRGVSLSDSMPNNFLPYLQNSNNWVKKMQRFPVEIEVPESELDKYPLRRGATATVTILTSDNRFWNGLARFFHWFGSSIKGL